MRNYGLTCDNLTGATVVTTDGEIVRASESEHPDLFGGLRGGGGNFGVVTEFEFQLHEIGHEVLTVQIFHPFDVAGEALRMFREFMIDAPDELTCFPMIMTIPPMEPFPEEQQGETGIAFIGCWSGEVDAGRVALEPLISWGEPILPIVESMSYTAFKATSDEGQPGQRYYGKSVYIEELSDDLIDTLVDAIDALPNLFSSVWFESMGGAVTRVRSTETAFSHRDAAYNVGIGIGWSDPADDEAMMGWAQDIYEMVRPHSTEGIYANYLMQDDDVKHAFGENYDRLVKLKTEWDPENVFHMTQNIQPSADLQATSDQSQNRFPNRSFFLRPLANSIIGRCHSPRLSVPFESARICWR
ncbi:FAD-binding oxidoreductase [Halococcus sediminicola]|uniref:FAD-binding oxidoreductase n=1 Tax=Halococcus sediminicola TaxID=1264579 RepID=UPI0006798BB5|nr:BBE domain-containing protein [Halococcus sediminicola]